MYVRCLLNHFVRFLKTKISILHEEMDALRKENYTLNKQKKHITEDHKQLVVSHDLSKTRNKEMREELQVLKLAIADKNSELRVINMQCIT